MRIQVYNYKYQHYIYKFDIILFSCVRWPAARRPYICMYVLLGSYITTVSLPGQQHPFIALLGANFFFVHQRYTCAYICTYLG